MGRTIIDLSGMWTCELRIEVPGLYRLSYSVWQEILLPSEILSPNMANGVQTSSGRFPGDTSPNIGGLTKDSKKSNSAVVKAPIILKLLLIF